MQTKVAGRETLTKNFIYLRGVPFEFNSGTYFYEESLQNRVENHNTQTEAFLRTRECLSIEQEGICDYIALDTWTKRSREGSAHPVRRDMGFKRETSTGKYCKTKRFTKEHDSFQCCNERRLQRLYIS